METVAEMIRVVKEHYNLNDTLLAVELGVKSTGILLSGERERQSPTKIDILN